MSRYYVYVYYDGDVPVYVGKGQRDRAWAHLKSTKNKAFWDFICEKKELGISLLPTIEFRTNDEDEALAQERFLIMRCGRRDKRTGTLFNLSNGGERGGAAPTIKVLNRTEQIFAEFENTKADAARKNQNASFIKEWFSRNDDWNAPTFTGRSELRALLLPKISLSELIVLSDEDVRKGEYIVDIKPTHKVRSFTQAEVIAQNYVTKKLSLSEILERRGTVSLLKLMEDSLPP